ARVKLPAWTTRTSAVNSAVSIVACFGNGVSLSGLYKSYPVTETIAVGRAEAATRTHGGTTRMSANLNTARTPSPRVLIVAANPAVSPVTGWPVGFWAAELVHPYWVFTEAGYQVDIASPRGGRLELDAYSDPRDPSAYSAHD